MNRLILSAPFGEYLSWPDCTSTLGTYTLERRAGFWKRWWRVLSTVRYYPGIGGWKNRLGLPNPGLDDLSYRRDAGLVLSDKVISVTARATPDWLRIIERAAFFHPLAVELNVSCPNTPGEADESDYFVVYKRAAVQLCRAVVKLPPVNYETHLSLALSAGLDSFHCCNTLPTPGGGLSGKPLKALSLSAVRRVRRECPRVGVLIGGGGITHAGDVAEYRDAGATHFAVGSALFNPFNWRRIRRMADQLARQKEAVECTQPSAPS